MNNAKHIAYQGNQCGSSGYPRLALPRRYNPELPWDGIEFSDAVLSYCELPLIRSLAEELTTHEYSQIVIDSLQVFIKLSVFVCKDQLIKELLDTIFIKDMSRLLLLLDHFCPINDIALFQLV